MPSSAIVLQQALGLHDEQLDEDPSVALTALITSAVREEEPLRTLQQVADAINDAEAASYLEPLTLLPLLIPYPDRAVDRIVEVMARECSSKEMVMTAQEVVERFELDPESEECAEDDLWVIRQVTRILTIYSLAVPRLPRRKKSPSEHLQPLLSELQSALSRTTRSADSSQSGMILNSTFLCVETVAKWATSDASIEFNERTRLRDVLLPFVWFVLEVCSGNTASGLARESFERQFPRLVMPSLGEDPANEGGDVVESIWTAMTSLGLSIHSCESQPSLGSLVLMAHFRGHILSIAVLTSFFPVILMSLQANTALDEVLSILLDAIVPLRSQSPRQEFPPDLIVPLVHVLPPLASVHPDSAVRHYTFRVLSAALALAPSPARVQLLQGLLTDSDSSPQMRIAAIGLLKDALLEGLATAPESAEAQRNVFASPAFLRTFGPVVLRPDPPDLFMPGNTLEVEAFLDTKEPLRLVECLALYYVVLQRDIHNRTGIRDKDNLRNAMRTLVEPLKSQLKLWDDGPSHAEYSHRHDDAMQLAILDMWLDRVSGAIENLQ